MITLLNLIFFSRKTFLSYLRGKIILGKNVKMDFNSRIYNHLGFITLGNNVYLRSKIKGYQAGMPFPTTLLIDVEGATINIGENTRINGAYIHSQKMIMIGKNCVIASGVQILDSNGHQLLSSNRTIGRDLPEEIVIGNNVWIGLNAVILKGSNIGDNSVISTGSIVKGMFSSNSLIIGNPAIAVKKLDINNK